MIDISQEDFESIIKDIIDGKCTRTELLKELKTDRVTLNNKIQELVVVNNALYMQFISKFPYVPREYTHIDYEAMIIDIMKKGYTKKQAAEQYGINDRTISRKINKVQKENPNLVELYREVAYYRKHQKPLPTELQQIVDNLEVKEVFVGGIYDKREQELLEKERQYTATKMAGISDTEAYGNKRMSKDFSTLYRLEIEQLARNQQSATQITQPSKQNENQKTKSMQDDENELR